MPSPFPELPLPIRVADLEIAGGVPDLHRCHGYGGVYLLLRRHGFPLGSVTLAVSDDRVHAGSNRSGDASQVVPPEQTCAAAR